RYHQPAAVGDSRGRSSARLCRRVGRQHRRAADVRPEPHRRSPRGRWAARVGVPRVSGRNPRRQRVARDMSTSTSIDILGSYWTLAVGADAIHEQRCFHDFRKRVETAAKAGFKGMGLWHADLVEIRKTYSFKDMKQILSANGIVHIEVEWLLDWFTSG